MVVIRNKDKGNFLIRYVKSFRHAVEGYLYALKNEHNTIIILCATIIVIFLGVYFNIKVYEWLFCLIVIGMVSASEMINTSIEALVDLETVKYHPLAKIAKDTASSATLLFSLISLIGGLIIFIPYIKVMFRN
ncbi:MAG: diacylglycerol kinase family protein [Bacilli bacterium]